MKHKKLFLNASILLVSLSMSGFMGLKAQTDPGVANLKHQWTFDDGTANDVVSASPVNGVLTGGATIVNKALKLTTQGQYLSFSGTALALNAYPVISQEIWFTSVANANTGNTMLSYFGKTTSSLAYNYISTSSASTTNVSRTAISKGKSTAEIGTNGPEYDDGVLHQMVSIVRADSVILYIDGVLKSRALNDATHPISVISTSLAYLGKSGTTANPTWIGSIHKFSIYNKSLSASEIRYLYQRGAETPPAITVSQPSLSFDDQYKSDGFSVTGLNLSNAINITAPTGITVSPATLPANATNAAVTVTYNGSAVVNGNITLNSGSTVVNIPVKSYSNSCFTPLVPGGINLISDPYLTYIADFTGWGNKSINTDPTYVYCGSRSGTVTGINGGSIDVPLTGKLVPNTTYRVKAKVYAIGGAFQIGVAGIGVSDYIQPITTTGSWQDVDFTFTTGANPDANPLMYFNNFNTGGVTGYIDNWEMYAVPGITVSVNSIALDEYSYTSSFNVSGVSLTQPITITSPTGITLDKTSLAANASGVSVNVTYDRSTYVSGNITLTSGSVSKNISVRAALNSACFTPLYPNQPNLISDPYMNDLSNFSGWGNRNINTDPARVYCGLKSGQVTDWGSIDKNLTGVMKPNTTYRVKAKVFKNNPGNITYTLAMDPVANPYEYGLIKTAMDSACAIYNHYFPISCNIYVYYNAGIPTAQASNYGSIGFGSNTGYMWVGTAMHEIDHYLGSGTNWNWQNLVSGGNWNGATGNAVSQQLCGSNVYSDGTHFWPNGINYRSEIENLGGYEAQLNGLITNAKVAKAMIVDDAGLGSNKAPVGIGVWGWNGTAADIYHEVTVPGSWQDVDFTFTTGATLGATQGVFFNAGSGYIDNWEMYEVPAKITTSASYLSMDELNANTTFTVTGTNLGTGVTMTAPVGITLFPATLPAGTSTTTVTVSYNGASNSTGYLTLISGATTTRLRILATRNADSFTPLYPTATNLVGDVYLNDIANFGGWGNHEINSDTLYVYGGSRSGKVTGINGGSLDVPLTGKLLPNTSYRVRANVYAIGGAFQIGLWGTRPDYIQSAPTTGLWQIVDFTFTTGTVLDATQGMYFNNFYTGGMTGYIDNWEMYAVPPMLKITSSADELSSGDNQIQKVYVSSNDIITGFKLSIPCDVSVSICDLQGKQFVKNNISCEAGYNIKVIDSSLPKGVYIVKLVSGEFTIIRKVIK